LLPNRLDYWDSKDLAVRQEPHPPNASEHDVIQYLGEPKFKDLSLRCLSCLIENVVLSGQKALGGRRPEPPSGGSRNGKFIGKIKH
ncbi:MAG: hypothetical protein V4719_07115, partial [Planctomycetota bacterium]